MISLESFTNMKFLIVGIILLNVRLQLVYCTCEVSDWSRSFKQEGLSQCSNFIRGFVINGYRFQANKDIGFLEGAECCAPPSPWSSIQVQTLHVDWWESFDSQRLVECPVGFFLCGLWRSGSDSRLHNIEEGRCSKPVDHPRQYKDCYLEDISSCTWDRGTCGCRENYFVTGLGREACNDLNCLTKLKCCQMMVRPDALDGMDKVKTMIMDKTLPDVALLAHMLGYGWVGGCREPYVGEGYLRVNDIWEADKSSRCKGYKSDHRLSMEYGDWGYELKGVTFGDPIVQNLEPETVHSSVLTNNDSTSAKKTVKVEKKVIREVTNINTTYCRQIHELGVSLRYRNPFAAGSIDYRFGYEKSSTTYNSDNKQVEETFTLETEKVIEPFSSKKWHAKLFKSKTILPYTVTIAIKFSVLLRGFLRWGGGYNGGDTNYHVQYRGDDRRVTFNYKFGNQDIPFYKDLLDQSSKHSSPWQWFNLFVKYPHLQTLIDHLTLESNYEFNLTGRFEDVAGVMMVIDWEPVARRKREPFPDSPRYQVFSDVIIAKTGPHDPPAINEVTTEAVLDTTKLEEFDMHVEIPISV